MMQCVHFCVIFMILYSSVLAFTHPQKQVSASFHDVLYYPASSRQKRSLFKLGAAAVKSLLKGAMLIHSDGYIRYYIKFGGYQRAVDDFYSVKPSAIKNLKLRDPVGAVKKGKVGDRSIVVLKGYHSQPPSLAITKTKDIELPPKKNWESDVIMYYD